MSNLPYCDNCHEQTPILIQWSGVKVCLPCRFKILEDWVISREKENK